MMRTDDFAIFTVTYAGLMESFRDLCASIDLPMPGMVHHVGVDRAESVLFHAFETAQHRVHPAEDFLPPSWQARSRSTRCCFQPVAPHSLTDNEASIQ